MYVWALKQFVVLGVKASLPSLLFLKCGSLQTSEPECKCSVCLKDHLCAHTLHPLGTTSVGGQSGQFVTHGILALEDSEAGGSSSFLMQCPGKELPDPFILLFIYDS